MNLFDVYPLFDVNIVKGKGCHVWDDKGQEYLDLYGGHAVISVGHCHPHYIEKLTRQLGRLGFYSNSVVNKLQVELAERLGKACGYEDYQFFLINSGAEANENALKLASFYNGRKRVLSLSKAFHGRTSLAVEATDNPKIIAPINANGHVTYLPLNDLDAFKAELAKGDVCAVIVECIQGVGGIRLATAEFMQGVRQACDETDTVLICDEIQCGYGRSGKFFARPAFGGEAGLDYGGQRHRQRFPHGSGADFAQIHSGVRPVGHDFRWKPFGLCRRLGRVGHHGRGASGGKCRQGRKFPDGRYKGFAPASCGGCQGARPDDRRGVGRALQGNQEQVAL